MSSLEERLKIGIAKRDAPPEPKPKSEGRFREEGQREVLRTWVACVPELCKQLQLRSDADVDADPYPRIDNFLYREQRSVELRVEGDGARLVPATESAPEVELMRTALSMWIPKLAPPSWKIELRAVSNYGELLELIGEEPLAWLLDISA